MSRAAIAPGHSAGFALRLIAGAGVTLLALFTLSCASSNALQRRSDKSLQEGQVSRAYDFARRSLDKDPKNDRARASMTTAATQMSADWKRRIRDQAATDSLAAADATLDFARFRAELAHYDVVLSPDPAFREDENRIRLAAAAHYYKTARMAFDARKPKQAYLDYSTAGRFVPGFRDLATRIPKTYELALTRVAILPFANQTEVPGLSKQMADHIYGEVDDHLTPKQFQFTRLVDNDRVYANMTVSQLEQLSRDDAIRIGRSLGVDRVVWGHFSNFTTNSTTGLYNQTIYRHVVDPDPTAKDRDRYEESNFTAVTRQREVKVAYEFEVLDVRSQESLSHRGDQMHAVANTVYSLYQARGNPDDYCLLPPSVREHDAARAERVDKEWEATFGHWTIGKLLLSAREGRGRSRYRPEYRKEFLNASYIFPVFLDDLPAPNDMALMALDASWQPVWESLRDLDDQDTTPAPAVNVTAR